MRDSLLAEAATWVGTPYHMLQACKGVGADCIGWIVKAMAACLGTVLPYPPGQHMLLCAGEWCLHSREERLYHFCQGHPMLREVSTAEPGDILLMRTGVLPMHHTAMLLPGGMIQQALPGMGVHVARLAPVVARVGAAFEVHAC